VLAAAIVAEAEAIVTLNMQDFPAAALSVYEITAERPDSFLCRLFANSPAKVLEAVRNQRRALKTLPRRLRSI
jgi:hypothetical protein